MGKKLALIGSTILLLLAGWYFLVKEHDYQVRFTTQQTPGVVFNYLKKWNNWQSSDTKKVQTVSYAPFKEITQHVEQADSLFTYRWTIERINDSTTQVIAFVTDEKNSLNQKLFVPFSKNAFVQRVISTVTQIRGDLALFDEKLLIGKVTKTSFEGLNTIYIPVRTTIANKAREMMMTNARVMEYFYKHELPLLGKPTLEVTQWDQETDSITFNFHFPIPENAKTPPEADIQRGSLPAQEAIQTTFNGNYRISDQAWYTLIDYADRKEIDVEKLPIEVFMNDPHQGGNPLEWEAKIYMPIKS
ncbi:hypothetical protein GCM10009117_20250 [Gangjinia marincola]|uniref:AraC effector-binding domain-containing protein n=1 Tax=Gangjinia marincola TaxID=578463 RepID=A0ABN1MIV5_9FLAO